MDRLADPFAPMVLIVAGLAAVLLALVLWDFVQSFRCPPAQEQRHQHKRDQ